MAACWGEDIFVEPRSHDDPLRCPICSEIMGNTVQCPNEHCFGEQCLMQALSVKPECPTCRVPMDPKDLRPSRMVRSIIGRLQVKCSNRDKGCRESLMLESLSFHEQKCGYATVICPYSGCSARCIRKDLPAHMSQCSYATINCEICQISIPRNEVSQHSCLNQMLKRLVEVESTIKVQSKQLTQQQSLIEQMKNDHDAEVKVLHRKVHMLENELTTKKSRKSKKSSFALKASGPKRPTIDDIVVHAGDNAFGCLQDGHCGWIVKDERDHQPFLVQVADGGTYWYRESEVKLLASPEDDVSVNIAHYGLPVVRGPDWNGGDQDQFRYGIVIASLAEEGTCQVRWQAGNVHIYRAGARDFYDLRVARMSLYLEDSN